MVHNIFFKLDSVDQQDVQVVAKKKSKQSGFEAFIKLENKLLLTKKSFNEELVRMDQLVIKKYRIIMGIKLFLIYKSITEHIHYYSFEFEEHTKRNPILKSRIREKKRVLFSNLQKYIGTIYNKHTHFSVSFHSNQYSKNDYQSYIRQLDFDSILDMFIILLKNNKLKFVNINLSWWYCPAMIDLLLLCATYCDVYLHSMHISTSFLQYSHNIIFYNFCNHPDLLDKLLHIKTLHVNLDETFLKKSDLFQSNLNMTEKYFEKYANKKKSFYKSFLKSVTSENLHKLQKQWYIKNVNEMVKFKIL